QWMSFGKTLGPAEQTAAKQPRRTQLKPIYLATAVILAGAAASLTILLRPSLSNNGPAHTPSPASLSATQTTESVSTLAQQPPAATAVPASATAAPASATAVPASATAVPSDPTAKPVVRKSREVKPETLSKKEGFAFISANAWADVFINSRLVGRLPMAKSLQLKEGTHRLRLINPMTEPLETTIRVKSNQLVKLHFNLVPRQTPPADTQ
ncbi:MAG: hypothetical protein RL189_2320, partial [Pseudomonadota bacterium]